MARTPRIISIVIGIVAVLIGAVWIGQGLNLIPGSFMTGNRMWFYIGVVVALFGLILVILGLRRAPRSR
ncbi:MAG TPA: hypothetical protein VIT20_12045 [Propionibacteriaceae bacterium]